MDSRTRSRSSDKSNGYQQKQHQHQQRNGKNFKNNKKKYVPVFNKKPATWKLVDAESSALLPRYDQVGT